MADLTAIILTMNESKNIGECIKSVKGIASRIVVVDSGSTDNTVEIAKELDVDVCFHDFENYAKQFNWTLDNTNIKTKWVLRIDADERFTDKLCYEADQAMIEHADDDINGIVLRIKVFFLGKWIKHGGVYPMRDIKLFKMGIGLIEDRKMDEHTILRYGRTIELKNDVIHYDFKNLNYWINKQNWYATREMQDYYEANNRESIKKISNKNNKNRRKQKIIYYKLPMFYRAFFLFIFRYIFQLGFLDGKEGLIFQFLLAFWYRFLVDAKIYEYKKIGGKMDKTGALRT